MPNFFLFHFLRFLHVTPHLKNYHDEVTIWARFGVMFQRFTCRLDRARGEYSSSCAPANDSIVSTIFFFLCCVTTTVIPETNVTAILIPGKSSIDPSPRARFKSFDENCALDSCVPNRFGPNEDGLLIYQRK